MSGSEYYRTSDWNFIDKVIGIISTKKIIFKYKYKVYFEMFFLNVPCMEKKTNNNILFFNLIKVKLFNLLYFY
jgi:hypothetical protein